MHALIVSWINAPVRLIVSAMSKRQLLGDRGVPSLDVDERADSSSNAVTVLVSTMPKPCSTWNGAQGDWAPRSRRCTRVYLGGIALGGLVELRAAAGRTH